MYPKIVLRCMHPFCDIIFLNMIQVDRNKKDENYPFKHNFASYMWSDFKVLSITFGVSVSPKKHHLYFLLYITN